MTRIPIVIVAALFAGLIGALVIVSVDLTECIGYDVSFDKCWRRVLRKWETVFAVFVSAGVGGALSARFFGSGKEGPRGQIGRPLLGAFLSTLYGGAIAGVILAIMVGLSLMDVIFAAAVGGISGFYAAFSTWGGAFCWIVGFTLLELAMRKCRQYEE